MTGASLEAGLEWAADLRRVAEMEPAGLGEGVAWQWYRYRGPILVTPGGELEVHPFGADAYRPLGWQWTSGEYRSRISALLAIGDQWPMTAQPEPVDLRLAYLSSLREVHVLVRVLVARAGGGEWRRDPGRVFGRRVVVA